MCEVHIDVEDARSYVRFTPMYKVHTHICDVDSCIKCTPMRYTAEIHATEMYACDIHACEAYTRPRGTYYVGILISDFSKFGFLGRGPSVVLASPRR